MDFTIDEVKVLGTRISQAVKRWRFGNKKQLAFLEDLSLLINDGIPANRAIEMMSQISTTGLTQEVALNIAQKIAQGQPLADGMQDWFASNVVEIVRVGEAGGALPQTLKSAISMLSQQGIAIGAFVGAVSYPLFVIAIGCAVIVYLNNSVFSQFRMIKPMNEWPAAGRELVDVAHFIESWWWIVILGVISITLIFRHLLNNYVGDFRAYLDSVPPFNLYRRIVAARLLETLGLLVANGVVFKGAIKIMQYQANPYLRMHLLRMEHLLSMGRTNIAEVLDTGLVSDSDLLRLRIMAEVKGFEHGLIRMGVHGTEQGTETLKFVARILGGIFLTIGALLIIVIIQGIYLTGMAMGQP